MLLAKGGNGGWGNLQFKSSTNRAPARANPGQEGVERTIWLRLKLIADAGLVGLPNAGKSTFLAAVSNARPKIADYPFTTLVPNLGVVGIDGHEFVMADIPGLIEGASEGRGLGDQFLAHVERCAVLLHLVDGTSSTITKDYRTIVAELEAYADALAEKPRITGAEQDRRAGCQDARHPPQGAGEGLGRAGLRDLGRVGARACRRCCARFTPRSRANGRRWWRTRRGSPDASCRPRHARGQAAGRQDRLGAAGGPGDGAEVRLADRPRRGRGRGAQGAGCDVVLVSSGSIALGRKVLGLPAGAADAGTEPGGGGGGADPAGARL